MSIGFYVFICFVIFVMWANSGPVSSILLSPFYIAICAAIYITACDTHQQSNVQPSHHHAVKRA